MGRNQWVVPTADGRWAQKGEGAAKATKTFGTQKEAIAAARETARNQESELIIQGQNGKIRQRDSYGSDPCPPPG